LKSTDFIKNSLNYLSHPTYGKADNLMSLSFKTTFDTFGFIRRDVCVTSRH